MPDFVPAEHRSKANAITRIATSLTIVVSSLAAFWSSTAAWSSPSRFLRL